MKDRELLRAILESGQNTVEAIGKSFSAPDDDWAMMALLVSGDHQEWTTRPLPLLFSDDEEKSRVFNIDLPREILASQSQGLLIVGSVWAVLKEQIPGLAASKHPDREELLVLSGFTRENSGSLVAKINRFPERPPQLSPWVEVNSGIDRLDHDIYRTAIDALRVNGATQ